MALFLDAKTCPISSTPPGSATLEQLSKELERTGSVTVSEAQLTEASQKNFAQKVEDLRICFTDNKLNFSGKFKVGNFSPTFYATTILQSGNKLELKDSKIGIGGLSFQPFTDIFGGIVQQMLNDQLSKMPQEESFNIEIKDGELKIQAPPKSKKSSPRS